MANQQSSNDKSSARSMQSTGKNQQGQSAINNRSSEDEGIGNEQSGKLDQFFSFIKDNWKEVLTEMVTAGVTAYLAHNSKGKTASTSKQLGSDDHNH